MTYLLDTCVISEFTQAEPHGSVLNWLDSHDEMSLYLSVVTIGEVSKGVSKLVDGVRQNRLSNWLLNDVIERFDGRILPIDRDVMLAWGQVVGTEQRRGVNLPTVDSFIAATALVHNMAVVSRNVHDLERCRISVINPWGSSGASV